MLSRMGVNRWYICTAAVTALAVLCGTLSLVRAESGTGKAVQITVVGESGKPLAGAEVVFLRAGGKPLDAVQVGKDAWLLKNAPAKLAISVRDGRDGGIIELAVPNDAGDPALFNVKVVGNHLQAELLNPTVVNTPPVKPSLTGPAVQSSIRSAFSDVNRNTPPSKPQPPASSNAAVKAMELLVPPANDACGSAVSVSVPSVTAGTTVEATVDAGLPACGTSVTAGGVWYTFMGTGTVVTASTCTNTPYDSKLTVFSGSCATPICVGGNDDTSGCGSSDASVTFCSTSGTTYLVLVHGFSAGTGTFELTLASGASCGPPANDMCTSASPIGPLPATVMGDNTFASNDTLPTGCGFEAQNKTIWYSVVGDGTTLTASTCNTGTVIADTEIMVLCQDCAAPLCIGGDDDACPATPPGGLKSIFSWCSEAGATYLIAVGTYQGSSASGVIQLDVSSSGSACSGAISCLVAATGACCTGTTCAGTMTEAACNAAGGTWYTGQSCPAFACPSGCGGGGETCATAAPISTLPYSASGNTCSCVNDYDAVCPYTGSTSQDVVFSYSPTSDQCVSISLCGNSAYDTKVYVYDNSCGAGTLACNDDSCSTPSFPSPYVSTLSSVSLLAGHTYYIVVDGYGGECGDYTLDIAQVACPQPCGICPPGATLENEADCVSVNGGCNSAPPVFSPIACGQTYCGTAVWDGATRDTDWYQITVNTDTEFTWTVAAEFAGVIGMVETAPLGNPDCSTATALDPFDVGAACEVLTVTRCVPPGTYWWFVAPDFNGPTFPCGADYTATLTCIGCTPPTCTGDTCDAAQVIPAVPYSSTGDSCLCNDNYDEACPYTGSTSPDTAYSYTPTQDECILISMCAGSAYDTKVYVYENSCPGPLVACNDDDCSSPFVADFVSQVQANLIAGNTYYIVVDGYGGECGAYTLDITPCPPPCDIVCGPGKTPENEPGCGIPSDTVNGGCNSAPPVFSPIACGQEYCGTSAFDGGLRDTDWYQVTVLGSTQFTWTAIAEFEALTGPVPTSPAGTGNCADLLGVVDPALFPAPCELASATTECLPAGTYWFFMAPLFGDLVECGKEYNVRLDCQPCTIPLGACCRPVGSSRVDLQACKLEYSIVSPK